MVVSVKKYDSTVTWQGYGEYILPGHALMTRLQAYQAYNQDFKFNAPSGLKSDSGSTLYATVGTMLNVGNDDRNGRYWGE